MPTMQQSVKADEGLVIRRRSVAVEYATARLAYENALAVVGRPRELALNAAAHTQVESASDEVESSSANRDLIQSAVSMGEPAVAAAST